MKPVRNYVEAMKSLYEENDYPSDRLIKNQDALTGFADEFNSRVHESFSSEEIASELERIRKDKARTGGLPRLGRSFEGPRFKTKPR